MSTETSGCGGGRVADIDVWTLAERAAAGEQMSGAAVREIAAKLLELRPAEPPRAKSPGLTVGQLRVVMAGLPDGMEAVVRASSTTGDTICQKAMRRIVEIAPELCADLSLPWFALAGITSAVIAVVAIDDVVDQRKIDGRAVVATWPTKRRRWSRLGDIAYAFRVVHVLRDADGRPAPIPCRGWQGFWTLPDDVAARVEEQLR